MEETGSIVEYLRERLDGKILDSVLFRGEIALFISREGVLDTFRLLKEDGQTDFNFLTDMTAVDYLGKKEARFEVVYHLASFSTRQRLRVKVSVPEKDPEVESLTPLWKGADWLEREIWDLFGIRFRGHPGLKRVLLYEEFQGHPLRKDYPVNQWQPLVPEREVKGTFVDERSRNKLMEFKRRWEHKD